MTKITSILLILLGFQAAFGAESNSSEKKAGRLNSAKKTKNWTIALNTVTESNLYKPGTPSHSATNKTTLLYAYKFKPVTIRAAIAGTKGLTDLREEKFSDGALQALHKVKDLNKWLSLSAKHSLTIPFSEVSKDHSLLRTAISSTLSLSWDMSQFDRNGSSLDYKVYGGKYFHKYKFQKNGKRNQSHFIGNELGYGFEANDIISFGIGAGYTRYFDYFGNTTDEYSIEESISFKVSEETTLTLGHYTGGSPLKANQRDTQIDIIDTRNATVYLDLTFVL